MYLVFADKTDDFKRIKATLGADAIQSTNRNSLIEKIEISPSVRVVVVAPSIKNSTAFELAEELRIDYPLVNVILLRNRIDVATLSSALTSGIKDVIDAQDATGLVNAVQRCEALSEQINQRSGSEDLRSKRGKVITVYSAKGGSGKTTISTNLAAALSGEGKSQVCLIDLDLQFGDVATALNMPPKKTISQALEMAENIDSEGLAKAIVTYDGGFDVLLAPANPSDIESITSSFIAKVLSTLQRNYDFIVVDTSPNLTEIIARTLQDSDLAILLTNLDMLAIKNLKLTLTALDALGLAKSKRKLIINRGDLKVGIEPSDIEELIDENIDAVIPNNLKVTAATNEGQLVIQAYPSNPVSRAISALAEEIKTTTNAMTREMVA